MTPEQETLVVDHLKLVERIATRLRCILPRIIEETELVGAGNLGLVKAALKFNPSRGVPFAAYAKIRIRGEMLDHLRKNGRVSRRYRALGVAEAAVVSCEELLSNGRETIGETLEDSAPGPLQVAESDDSADWIVNIFGGRDRRIVEMHRDGMTQEMIAAILGVSPSRICQLVSDIRAKVRARIGAGLFAAAG